jgi:hypothetical protein
MMARSDYEDQLTFATAEYFALRGWFATHFPAGEYRPVRVGAKLKRMGLLPGMPDFLIFSPKPPGRPGTAVELKSPKGTMKPNQKLRRDQLIDAGWLYFVCRDINEVVAVTACLG